MALPAAFAPLAFDALKWATEQIGSSKVQSYFNDGLAQMSDGTDTEQILHKVDDVLKEVQEVKAIANKMSQKLDEGVLNIRKDTLRSHFETIDSIFEKIRNCTIQAMENRQKIKDPTELKESLEDLQTEQELELRKAVDKVPEQLDHINGFLTNTDFISTAANLALQDSKDFLSYYKKMETLFTAYWGRVVQGIVLLNMARLTPDVLFGEAPQTILRHSEKLAAQVTAFYNVLGHDICLVAQSVLATSGNPDSRAPIIWSSGWGAGIKSELQWIPDEELGFFSKLIRGPNAFKERVGPHGWGYSGLKVQNGSERYTYLLQVTTDVSAKSFDLTKSYPMRLCEGSKCLTRFRVPDRQNGICMQEDSDYYKSRGQDDNKWYIRPVSVGSNNCYFETVDGGFSGAVLVTGWNQNELEWRKDIDLRLGFDSRVDRAYFQLVKG